MTQQNDASPSADSTSGDNSEDSNKEKLEESSKDAAAVAASKKEKQPQQPGDLSPIHNTKEVGTSGGDQRSKPSDPDESANTKEEEQ